ncbi:MAG: ATP-dependent helicase HrpB [Nitrospiraceae bacterium]
MTNLPIEQILPELCNTLERRRSVLLTAEPGVGKTTRVPLALLKTGWMEGQKLLLLEHRRLAARAAAHYMARLLGEAVGMTVGYRTRLDTNVGGTTRIEVVTEGILTRLLQHDPSLAGYGAVLFDEFHERSLQADLGLALTLESQRLFRPDLRLVVMSATLDFAALSDLLGQAPIISCKGRGYPVETCYLDQRISIPLDQVVAQTVRRALRQDSGSVLVFLPGMAEIRRVERRLQETPLDQSITITPLHGDLPQEAQDLAIAPPRPGRRKVVLTTSIAETSLTIEGVRVVVDAGLLRIPRYDPRSGLTRLDTIRVTQDSAEQRRGRAGRLEPGVCYRLWTEADQQLLLPRRPPEILESDLAPLVLELALWGTDDPGELSWLDPPPTGATTQARSLLIQLGGLDGKGKVTQHGRRMAELPLHPRLAHMVQRAWEQGAGSLACDVAALLSERDLLRGPSGWRNADLRLRLDALEQDHDPAGPARYDRTLGHRIHRAAVSLRRQLAEAHESRARTVSKASQIGSLGALVALAYPDRIAQRQAGGDGRYLLANGRGAQFSSPDGLATEEYLVIAGLDGTGQWARIDLAAPVRLDELESSCAPLIQTADFIRWDERRKVVQARRQRQLGSLVLSDQGLPDPDPEQVSQALVDAIRRAGVSSLPWTKDLHQWRARVALLRRISGPKSDWPDVSDEALSDRLAIWLGPWLDGLTRWDQVQRLDLAGPLHSLLTREQQRRLDRLAPTHMAVPTGSRVRLDYESNERPVLAVRLQELFGCRETPRVADGKVSITIHLLSPAGRPVQVTNDLAGFWTTSYVEVRKELRGRYPKHHWPEDPLSAVPTSRAKRPGEREPRP